MIRQKLQPILLCMVLCCLSANTAIAGMVSVDFLDDSPGMSVGARSPGDSDGSRDSSKVSVPAPVVLPIRLDSSNLVNSQGATGGLGGTPSSHTNVQGESLALPVQGSAETDPELISRYIVEEAGLLITTTFLEQVFRPPRQFV